MYTIKDYLNYYKDTTIKDVHWNAMDNLLCAILIYVSAPSFSSKKKINDFFEYVNNYKESAPGVMAPIAYELLDIINDAKRYQDLSVSDYQNIKNDDTQFAAVTFRINNNTIVSFKGTDGSLIGWIENLRLGYQYPTNTQILAQKYLSTAISPSGENIYITGHSKGGNLAMASVMTINNDIYKRIDKIYNFDGPGFRKEEYESAAYKRLEEKLVNIVPTGSVVGTILNNKDYKVVKSTEKAFNEHYPNSWCIFGEHFVNGNLSSISKQLHEATTIAFEKLDQEKVEETFETIFKSLPNDYKEGINFNLNDLKDFYKNMRSVDSEVKYYLDTIIDTMIKATYIKEEK